MSCPDINYVTYWICTIDKQISDLKIWKARYFQLKFQFHKLNLSPFWSRKIFEEFRLLLQGFQGFPTYKCFFKGRCWNNLVYNSWTCISWSSKIGLIGGRFLCSKIYKTVKIELFLGTHNTQIVIVIPLYTQHLRPLY